MKLVKNGDDWKKWVFLLNEELFFLENADHAEENLYEVPGYKDKNKINWSHVENFKFKNIPEQIKLAISNTKEIINAPVTYAFIYKQQKEETYTLEIYWTIRLNDWDSAQNPVFIQRKMVEIHEYSKNTKKVDLIDDTDSGLIDLYFSFHHSEEDTIGSALQDAKIYIESLQFQATREISSQDSTGITASFEFRPEFQSACSRYLIYFIEFLKDLGIETTSDFTRKGNEILFSIEPMDKSGSLERIKEALAFYLAASESGEQITPSRPNPIIEFKIEKLNSEIQALRSNIKLHEALIQIQSDKIVELSTQDQHNGGKSPIEGLKSISTPDKIESKTEFFNGFIRLGKFQKFGFEFDWSAIKWLSKK